MRLYTILEKSKETVLEFYKGTANSFMRIYKWLKYNKVNVKLSGLQLYKLKSSVKN